METVTSGGDAGLDAGMMVPVRRLADFIRTRDDAALADVFAERDVVIIENFAPYVFSGVEAVGLWAAGMRDHLGGSSDLEYAFEPAIDFGRSGSLVYFSLPTRWSGRAGGRSFAETGGWAFVLVQERGGWRIRNYGWAVVRHAVEDAG